MASKKYVINLFSLDQLKDFEDVCANIKQVLNTEEFMIFIAEKAMKELNAIIDKELRTEEYETEYRQSNNYSTKKGEIIIYNDSMVDLSGLSEKTLANYAEGLSLAKIIEFGTGIPRN